VSTRSIPTARPSAARERPGATRSAAQEADLDTGAGQGHLSTFPVPQHRLGLLLAIGGVIGFFAAFTLTIERFRLAEDPAYVPSCNINPILSCGSVMGKPQAALFGFPNPLLGIGAFAIATTVGLLLASGVGLPRWMRVGLQAGITLGMVFVGWLISQSLYSIHALCPYCMVVWAVVVPMFWTVTIDNLDRGVLAVPAGARGAVRALVEYRLVAIIATYALVLLLVGGEFWSYWSSLV
jgi:uncharacterized membrane protein